MVAHTSRLLPAGRAGKALLVAGGGLLLLAALVHTPWVEDAVGGWALGRLGRAGISAQVERLRYNLLTLRVRAEGVSLATADSPQEPFLQSRAIEIVLPWSVLAGRVSIDAILLDAPHAVLTRRQDGSSNWPSSRSGASGAPAPFPVRRVAVRDLRVSWSDETLGARVEVDHVQISLAPVPQGAAGRFIAEQPVRFAWRGRETTVGAQAELAWDGTRLSVASARLQSPEIVLQIGGAIDLLAASPQVALDYDGRVDLAAATAWLSMDPRPSGTLTVRGRAGGGLSTSRAEVALTGTDLAWRGVSGVSLDAGLRADAHGVEADRLDARVAGGSIRAQGRIGFDDHASNHISAEWRGVDVGRLLAAAGAPPRARLAAELDGRAAASWTAWRADAVTASVNATMRPGGAVGRRPGVGGDLTLEAQTGQWRATIDQWIDEAVHVEGALGGRIGAGTLGGSTLGGRAALASDSLDGLWRVLQKFEVVPAGVPDGVAGRARVDVLLAGTIAEPVADARLTITEARRGPIGPITVDGQIQISTRDATLTGLEVRLGTSSLRASGSASFDGDRLRGRVEVNVPALDTLLAGMPPSLRPSGAMELTADIAGRISSPVVEGRLTAQAVAYAGQRADRIATAFRVAQQTITVERLEITQPDGRLEAKGTYALRTGAVVGTVGARNVALAPVAGADGAAFAPLSARADADVAVSGTRGDLRGHGRVELRDVQWADRRVGRVTGDLALVDRRLQSALRLPDLFTNVTVSLTLSPFGAFVVDAEVTDLELAVVMSRLGLAARTSINGTASFAAHVDGELDELARSHATLDLQRFDARVGDIPVRVLRPGRLSYDERGLDAGDFALDIGPTELRIAGRLGRDGGTLAASLDGTLGEVTEVAKAAMGVARGARLPELDGRASLAARVTGSIDRPKVEATARLDDGRVSISGLPPLTAVTLRASYAEGLVELAELGASWQDASLTASGRTPLGLVAGYLPDRLAGTLPLGTGAGRLTARFESFTPAMLARWVPAATLSQFGGAVSGTLTLEADAPTLTGVKGELVLDRAELSVAGVRLDEQRPTRLHLAGGRLQVVDWEWGGEDNRISLGGGVRLGAPWTLDLSVDGAMDLRVASAFVPGIGTAGRLALQAKVSGAASAPQFNGRVEVQQGEIRLASPRFVLSDLVASLSLTTDELTVSDFYGTANGGDFNIVGRLGYSGLRPTQGRLAITGRGMAMALPEPLKTEVDADLSLAIDRGNLSLGGEVTVLGGSYREPLSLAGGLLQALQQPEMAAEAESPSPVDAMALDVRIATVEDVIVDNNYAQLELGADVRLRGTVARPVLAGRAEAREGGRVFLGGHLYQLVGSGVVDFVNPSRIGPAFDITAVTRVGRDEITLTLKGPPSRLETTLQATDPSLSQSDIVSLLVTGRRPSGSESAPTIGRDQLVAYLGGEFLGVAGRAVGLDTLRIEPGGDVRFDAGLIATEINPGSRLTFGKQVTRDVEVVFSQNLENSGAFTWIVGYRPRRNVELRAVSLDNSDRIYDFRHDLTVGGPPVPSPAVKRRVGTVRLTGAPGWIEPDLVRRLRLTGGKRFDFFRWQRDRDNVEQFCRERGYLEARVVTRRTEAGDATERVVDLEHEVHLGPRTFVDISDAPRRADLREAVEAVWSHTVLDAFLVDEAVKTVRGLLVQEGYLRASVTASVELRDGGGEKHLVLTVSAGPRFDSSRLVLSGSQSMGAEWLEAALRARGLEEKAWLDPAPLERAATALYRDEGFLSARVAAGKPVFEGRAATLPVTIEEGPIFRVSRIEFVGAKSLPAEEVRAVFGLPPGAVLTRTAGERATQALGERYRKQGFSRVSVVLTSRPEAEPGAVGLVVSVDEGPRQVLREVAIEGTRRTRATLVNRELRLGIGQPVDASALAQARRRLYDTGVFRQVDLETVPMVEPEPGQEVAEQDVRALVKLEEWPPLRLRYGFALDDRLKPASEEGRVLHPGLAGDLTYRNLFGRAWSVGGAARYTSDFRAARGFVTTRSFFGLPLTSNLFLARSREETGTIERPIATDRTDFTVEQRFRLRGRLQIAYGYNFERNRTFQTNVDPDDPLAFHETVNVGRLTATGIFDSRDDLVDATRGAFFSSTFEYGASVLGSQARFVKQFVQQSYYHKFGDGFVFATAGRLGLARGLGQDVLLSEKFLAGGGASVRGYLENSLGPSDFFGPTGGNAMLVLNEELRFPILWRLRGVAFLDAGNVFATVGDFALGDLRLGAGLGLRVQAPFALLRVDVGAPLKRRPEEPRIRAFFSIGQMF